jgi:hypothetical protein
MKYIDPGFSPPAFCTDCGKPFPWLEAKLYAARQLTDDLGSLDSEEKELLKKSLDEIVKDTPQTSVWALRFKRLVSKAGKGAADSFKDILTDVLSEVAKKTIYPSP